MSSSKRSIIDSSSSSKESQSPSNSLSNSPSQNICKSPPKKSRRENSPNCAKKALEAIRYREPIKKGRMAELREMKERIDEAEKKLGWLDDLQDRILLKDPATEILDIADELCKENADRKARKRAEKKMWEGLPGEDVGVEEACSFCQ